MTGRRAASTFALTAVLLTACQAGDPVPPYQESAAPSPTRSPEYSLIESTLIAMPTYPQEIAVDPGYDRTLFLDGWSDPDHNGCTTRNDVLIRDLTDEAIGPGCTVLSGTLVDPYTGRTIPFTRSDPSAVQIDHVVSLSNAWQTGAENWTPELRREFAQDPLNLLAVDGPTNELKGDGDAAAWLPPDVTYRCAFVARQIAVKHKYELWMTRQEYAAIARVIFTFCPDQPLPQDS